MNYFRAALIQILSIVLLASFGFGGTVAYEYDSRNRLVKASYPDGTAAVYTYDNIGNRKRMEIVNPDLDDDELPDIWEIRHFNNLDRDGTGDFDGDGISDRDEYFNGTDPAPGTPQTTLYADPSGGVFAEPLFVTLSMEGSGTIYYTLDGSEPDEASTVYQSPIEISGTTVLKAFARPSGGDAGGGLTETYEITTDFFVDVITGAEEGLSGINVYAFTEEGSYTGVASKTNESGRALFEPEDLEPGNYRFRADYLSSRFWSGTVHVPGDGGVEVVIEEAPVRVNLGREAGEGVTVYLFNGNGTYLGINAATDADGTVRFDLPVGETYLFRADILGSRYWSDPVEVEAEGENPVGIVPGGGALGIMLAKGDGTPISGVSLYLFDASDSYLGLKVETDAGGMGEFVVTDGVYRVRADYMGKRFWSDEIGVYGEVSRDMILPHRDVRLTVSGDTGTDIRPMAGIATYLFSAEGAYLGISETTDESGTVTYNLPHEAYKVRVDYLGARHWSEEITGDVGEVAVVLGEGFAEVRMREGGLPLSEADVYLFSESGAYLGIHEKTDTGGMAVFRLPGGTYRFRGDHKGNQYWATGIVEAPGITVVDLDTGGGAFVFTLLKEANDPMADIPVYLFSEGGSYLGESGRTDETGTTAFDLPDGEYRFRSDYLGYQFWSDLFIVPDTLFGSLLIPHRDVTVGVTRIHGEEETPIADTPVYLFSPAGSYLGIRKTTDEGGEARFSLPEEPYKVRVDYMAKRYWSDSFNWEDAHVSVAHGDVRLHVLKDGVGVTDVPAYLFSETGSYLSLNTRTDAEGFALFDIPVGRYKFRADFGGEKYWSDVTEIPPHLETAVEIQLE